MPPVLFQSRKQDYFNWKDDIFDIWLEYEPEFQSRKQDYFNWKPSDGRPAPERLRFSPASRIILIESIN